MEATKIGPDLRLVSVFYFVSVVDNGHILTEKKKDVSEYWKPTVFSLSVFCVCPFMIQLLSSKNLATQAPKFAYRVFQKFVPILNCILRKAFNASLAKCKLIQVGNLFK